MRARLPFSNVDAGPSWNKRSLPRRHEVAAIGGQVEALERQVEPDPEVDADRVIVRGDRQLTCRVAGPVVAADERIDGRIGQWVPSDEKKKPPRA